MLPSVKGLFAFLLISIAILIVVNDGYKIENGWTMPETYIYHLKFLSNSAFEKLELSFRLKKAIEDVLWWEQVYDGGLNRILSGVFCLIDAKFRAWLFQYIPPSPAVAFSWLIGLLLTPLLLFNFLKRHIKLGIVGSSAVTVLFIASPSTVGNTFMLYHPARLLVVFFYILLLNIFMVLNNPVLSNRKNKIKRIGFFTLAIIILFISLFTDPYIYAIFLLIPVFFPRIFVDLPKIKYFIGYFSTNFFAKIRIVGLRRIIGQFINCLSLRHRGIYVIYGLVTIAFILSVFFVLPWLASLAGFSYRFIGTVRDQVAGGATLPSYHVVDPNFYKGIFINMYWFVVANVGLRNYLPIGAADLGNLDVDAWLGVFTPANVIIYLLPHVICWGFYLILRYKFGLFRKVFGKIVALYVVTAWITFVHGMASAYLVPYSTYFYGSPFSIIFALFLGAVLYTFREHKKTYLILVVTILISAGFTYEGSKEINRKLKQNWSRKLSTGDEAYRESRKAWYDIKHNNKPFDENVCKIDEVIRCYYLNIEKALRAGKYKVHNRDYTHIYEQVPKNKVQIKAMNFAAFGSD